MKRMKDSGKEKVRLNLFLDRITKRELKAMAALSGKPMGALVSALIKESRRAVWLRRQGTDKWVL